ncbi:MAG: acyl transferase [Saprospiraceae bacterium]|nr:acyl transferase [Saprospiraceae bacterium]
MKSMNEEVFALRAGSTQYQNPKFEFSRAVEQAYDFQRNSCEVYKRFLDAFDRTFDPGDWACLPFLPVTAFKDTPVRCGSWHPEVIFRSSGTSSSIRSQHWVRSVTDYQMHTIQLFEQRFGSLKDFRIFALLPNYLEAGDSSLVTMVRGFMDHTQQSQGFYLHDFAQLQHDLLKAAGEQRILFIGVTFALLDFATKFNTSLPDDTIILETGGMKGRGQELSRTDLHSYLATQFGTGNIYSEYGMTELMSQAYSDFNGKFVPPSSMSVSMREINDPLTESKPGKVGVVNIIDLANIDTCCFISTSDLGIKHRDGSFEIVGRLEQSDIRGCHLMYLQ